MWQLLKTVLADPRVQAAVVAVAVAILEVVKHGRDKPTTDKR